MFEMHRVFDLENVGKKVHFHLKSLLQVPIKVTKSYKLYQSILCVPNNQKNFCAIDFRPSEKPSISRWFPILNLKLLIALRGILENTIFFSPNMLATDSVEQAAHKLLKQS